MANVERGMIHWDCSRGTGDQNLHLPLRTRIFFFIRSHNLTILRFSHLEPEQCNSLIEVLQAGVKPLLNVYIMCSEEYWLDSRACVNYVLFLAFILFSSFLLGLLCWVSILVKVHQRNETRDFIIVPGCLKFREIGALWLLITSKNIYFSPSKNKERRYSRKKCSWYNHLSQLAVACPLKSI